MSAVRATPPTASLGWLMIRLPFAVRFVFLALDLIGARTVERDLEEVLGRQQLPPSLAPNHGVLY